MLWSNPLTNSADCVNWTLTFASTNLAGLTTNPVVIPSYTNAPIDPSLAPPGGNNYDVQFGWAVANDNVPPSPTMLLNGWDKVLRMTCNKDYSAASSSGVNVFPRGQKFGGNFALRFDMYLSIYSQAINQPYSGTYDREFAAFGINHYGTNCMWRMDTGTVPSTQPGSGMTNFDGVWFSIGADTGSSTPADWDAYISPAVPNSGVPSDLVSNPNTANTGLFKKPPFVGRVAGGQPVNQWVDVSVEVTRQTNVTLKVDSAQVLGNFFLTNRGFASNGQIYPVYTNGTIMLGYIDPIKNVSDQTAFVYFSNVRVVELSPYLLVDAARSLSAAAAGPGIIVTQGQTFTLTNIANLGTAPLTNTWWRGTTNAAPLLFGIVTNIANATNITSILTNTMTGSGTNFYGICSDSAGSVTTPIVIVEVVGVTNQIAFAGSTYKWPSFASGNMAPAATGYGWKTNGVLLATNAHYNGGNSSALWITNVTALDAGIYTVSVTNNHGVATPSAALTVIGPGLPASRTNLWGSSLTFSVPTAGPTPTYQWKKNGANIGGATTSSLSFGSLTTADAGIYACAVANGLASAVTTNAVLTVLVPPPTFSVLPGGPPPVSVGGGSVVLSFSSTNNLYDTTNAFMLLQSPVVSTNSVVTNMPWTTNLSAVWTTNGATPPLFQVTVPDTAIDMFYKLLHVQ